MAYPSTTPHDHVTVSPGKPARAIQTVQGVYYILAGLVVALFLGAIQGPLSTDGSRPGTDLWFVRVIALAVAAFGVALVASGRRDGRGFVPAGAGMWVALALLAQSAAGMAFGILPRTFLADAALELLFVVWWVAVMFSRVDRQIRRADPMPSA